MLCRWAEQVKEDARLKTNMRRIMFNMLNRVLISALRSWEFHWREQKRRRYIGTRIVTRMLQQAALKSFHSWVDTVRFRRCDETSYKRAEICIAAMKMRRALRGRLLKGMVHRFSGRAVAKAFESWLLLIDDTRLQEQQMTTATTVTQLRAALSDNERHVAKLISNFEDWSSSTNHRALMHAVFSSWVVARFESAQILQAQVAAKHSQRVRQREIARVNRMLRTRRQLRTM
eukprot:SAG31_NODE_11492_length_1024_cov_1.540541_2_plen_230_part_01